MRMSTAVPVLLLSALLAACSQAQQESTGQAVLPLDTREQSPPVADPSQPVVSGDTPAAADAAAVAGLNARFDPARDPQADLATAKVEAQRGGKRIILDVGGEWCGWCLRMDAFVEGDEQIRRYRDAHYVWMKVNYSEDNENRDFLAGFPPITAYPHLFVLDAQGELLHSQFTGELEKGKGYDRAKFFGFLKDWAPQR